MQAPIRTIAVGEIPSRHGATASGFVLLVGRLGIRLLATLARALLELVLRLSEAASELRQLRPTEDEKDDEQDDDEFRWSKAHGRSFPSSRTAYVAVAPGGSSIIDDPGDLPSTSGIACGSRRSVLDRHRCHRERAGTCAEPRGRLTAA